jgi:hypothetical protein
MRLSTSLRLNAQKGLVTPYDPALTLDLQFAARQAYVANIGPLPTFTNASTTRTFVGSDGLIQTAATNVPRIDFDPVTRLCRGLLIEEQRTNLVSRSEDFADASWAKYNGTVTSNTAVAPDGASTADLIYPSATGSLNGQAYKTVSSGIVSGNSVTVSVFVKASGKNFAYVSKIQNSFSADCYLNLTTGAITNVAAGCTATAEQYSNGWWRLTLTSTAGAGPYYAVVGSTDAAGSTTNTVSGTNGILIWGFVVEVGAFATSYIPTTTGSLIRSADVCSITGAAFTGFWNAAEGTIALKIQKAYAVPASISQVNYLSVNDGTANNYIQLAQRGQSPTGEVFRIENGGTSQALIQPSTSVIAVNTPLGIAGVYKSNDARASCNGAAVVSDATVVVPTVTQLNFVLVSSALWISSLQYYNVAKTNAQLQALSTP